MLPSQVTKPHFFHEHARTNAITIKLPLVINVTMYKRFIMQVHVTKFTTHLLSCQSSRVYFLWCLGEAGILILGSSVGMHCAAWFSSTTLTDDTASTCTWYSLLMAAVKTGTLGRQRPGECNYMTSTSFS